MKIAIVLIAIFVAIANAVNANGDQIGTLTGAIHIIVTKFIFAASRSCERMQRVCVDHHSWNIVSKNPRLMDHLELGSSERSLLRLTNRNSFTFFRSARGNCNNGCFRGRELDSCLRSCSPEFENEVKSVFKYEFRLHLD